MSELNEALKSLIEVLERKNLCFRSFNKLCLDFIDEIARGDVNRLEDFQRRRESLIKVLDQLEREQTERLGRLGDPAKLDPNTTQHARQKIDQLHRERAGLVQSILALDKQILAHIDRIKQETIQKIQSLNTGRKTISAYKSPIDSVEQAEKAKSLDREA